MKIIKDIEQGSPEWLALRLGRPSASGFSNLIRAIPHSCFISSLISQVGDQQK